MSYQKKEGHMTAYFWDDDSKKEQAFGYSLDLK